MRYGRAATIVVMLCGIAFYIGWDVVAGAESAIWHARATISEITINYLWEHPPIAVVLGGLLGHLTWPRRDAVPWWRALLGAGGALVALLGLDAIRLLPPVMPVLPLLIGVAVGHALWGQGVATEQGR